MISEVLKVEEDRRKEYTARKEAMERVRKGRKKRGRDIHCKKGGNREERKKEIRKKIGRKKRGTSTVREEAMESTKRKKGRKKRERDILLVAVALSSLVISAAFGKVEDRIKEEEQTARVEWMEQKEYGIKEREDEGKHATGEKEVKIFLLI